MARREAYLRMYGMRPVHQERSERRETVTQMLHERLCERVPRQGGAGRRFHLRKPSALSGALTSFMDRAFYGKGKVFRYKPAAGIVSARRGGTTAAFDQVNKYFTISSMPVVSSKYWNMVHGNTPEQVLQDEEGMQVMRELGRNMAWLLKCIEAGRAAGIPDPVKEKPVMTNFIR